MDVLD
jgi:hypothetical protein